MLSISVCSYSQSGPITFGSEYNRITWPTALGYGGGITGDDGQYKRLTLYHGHSIALQTGTNDRNHANTRLYVKSDGNIGIGTTTPNTTLDINGVVNVRKTGLIMSLGDNVYADTYLQIRNNSPYGVRLGLKASQFGSTNGIGLIQTGGSRGFGIKVNEQLGFNTVTDPEFFIQHTGNVGIGTTSPDSKLTVKGNIHAEEVKVDLSVPGPDYVFEPNYDLKSLEEIEKFIKSEKHLPEIPSAKEMEANGVQLGEMNMLLLKKIEELTLHLIEVNKENTSLRQQLNAKSQSQDRKIEELTLYVIELKKNQEVILKENDELKEKLKVN